MFMISMVIACDRTMTCTDAAQDRIHDAYYSDLKPSH
jgi:hypothetical protein